MSGAEGAGKRPDDVVFVRRCRIIVAGLIRVVSLAIAGAAVLPLLMGLSGGSFVAARGGSPWAVVMTIVIGSVPLVGACGMWFSAGWLSRRVFPEVASRNQCPKCKYPLEGLEGERCPECGARVR